MKPLRLTAIVVSVVSLGAMSAFAIAFGAKTPVASEVGYSGDRALTAGLGGMVTAPVEAPLPTEAVPTPSAAAPTVPAAPSQQAERLEKAVVSAPPPPPAQCQGDCSVPFDGTIPGAPGSALDPRGHYHLECPGVLEVVPGTKGEATCTLSSSGFKGPVTLDCGSPDGLICTEPNGVVVNLGLNQRVPVKFYVDVSVGALAGPYTLYVRHDGDASPKLPMPYLLQVMVPNMLPPCGTALPLNCYMDPSRLVTG
jgi:hypothetical protein